MKKKTRIIAGAVFLVIFIPPFIYYLVGDGGWNYVISSFLTYFSIAAYSLFGIFDISKCIEKNRSSGNYKTLFQILGIVFLSFIIILCVTLSLFSFAIMGM